jgi:hypothetical protein
MPDTSKILIFSKGQYLKTPFNQLSSTYVYRSSVHNCPVYDALTADPANKRLFLFQSTITRPIQSSSEHHSIQFNKLLSYLKADTTGVIDDIYFFTIVSAHQKCSSHHLFSFVLDDCFLAEYSLTLALVKF